MAVGKWNGGPVVMSGITAWPSSALALRIEPGLPQMFARKPCDAPRMCIGLPNAILNANSTQTMSTRAKATNASIIEFTDHRFCITPP